MSTTAVKERPIPFSGEMVRAILEGRKSQTRRICKTQPQVTSENDASWRDAKSDLWRNASQYARDCCPYGVAGDRLWVREAWAQRLDLDHLNGTQLYEAGVRDAWYWADGPGKCCRTGSAGAAGRVRIGRFMPRWASRITLEITDVRVQRLHDLRHNIKDLEAEGIELLPTELYPHTNRGDKLTRHFAALWESINGPGSWDSNPFVWALSFRKL